MIERDDILDAYHRRYATKRYNPNKKINEENWQTILETARLSPSSYVYEPWKFLEINNYDIRKDLQDMCWGVAKQIMDADKLLICLVYRNLTIHHPHVKHMVEDVKGKEFDINSKPSQHFDHFQRSDMDLVDEHRLFDWASKQSYIAMGNMMTTAAMLGVDSCAHEGFPYRKVEEYLDMHQLMNNKEYGISYMLTFGYRDEPIKEKHRQSMEQILKVVN